MGSKQFQYRPGVKVVDSENCSAKGDPQVVIEDGSGQSWVWAFTKELGAKLPGIKWDARPYLPQISQIGWNEKNFSY